MNRTRNEALNGADGVWGLLGIVSAPVKRREWRPKPDGRRSRQAWQSLITGRSTQHIPTERNEQRHEPPLPLYQLAMTDPHSRRKQRKLGLCRATIKPHNKLARPQSACQAASDKSDGSLMRLSIVAQVVVRGWKRFVMSRLPPD